MGRPLRLLTVIGARPQIIKAAAIHRAIAARAGGSIVGSLLHTGQHYDANMSQVFFDELQLPPPDIQLAVGDGPAGARTARMIEGIERVLAEGRHDVVLLFGDTDSTLAGAVAAARARVPIAHVEAGLRSFNKRMPEEINRIVCDHCSTWLFCPTDQAVKNLQREGFDASPSAHPTVDRPAVVLSGDVMYDNALHYAAIANERSTVLRSLALDAGAYLLATVHRANNTDDGDRLHAIFTALLELHRTSALPIVLPLHPRTRARLDEGLPKELAKALRTTPGFHLIPPVGFLDLLTLVDHARMVITDSGGLQKEAYFFGKPCLVLRAETEWTELVQARQVTLVDADPQRIAASAQRSLAQGHCDHPTLFGDGHAAEHICDELLRYS